MSRRSVFAAALAVLTVLMGTWFWQRSSAPPPRLSGAMRALDAWSAQRAYPGKIIPAAGHYDAYQYSRERFGRAEGPTEEAWQTMGPHNIGGRTLVVAVDPQRPGRIWAGTASGGLWRSDTDGFGADAWDLVPTGHPVLGVSSIAFSPDDAKVIYIGTGEVYAYQDSEGGVAVRTTRGSYGIGILKSTDGGESWTSSLNWARHQERGIWAVEVDPNDADVVWAATTEGTFKSTDAGSTWINQLPVIMGVDLVINPDDSDIVYAAHGNLESSGHGIYRTTDGGATWEQLSQGLPSNFGGKVWLDLVPTSPNILYASIGNGYWGGAGTWLCRTDDGGDTWQVVNTFDYATYQGWFAHFVTADPNDPDKIIVGGVDVYTSDDGGATLTQRSFWYLWEFGTPPAGGPEGPPNYSHADHHWAVRHPSDPNVVYFGNDGGVFISTDSARTFAGRNGGFQCTQFYAGFACAVEDSFVALGGMQDNSTAIYQGSLEWYRAIGGDGGWAAVDPTLASTLYGSWQYLSMLRSTNGGVDWVDIPPPNRSIVGFIAPYVVAPSEANILYAGKDVVFRSTDQGSSWVSPAPALDGNPVLSLAVSRYDSNVVYATTAPVYGSAGVFVSTDGAGSWTEISADLPDRYPMDIAIDPDDDAVVYVAFSGFGTSHLYKSIDRGSSWMDIGGELPDAPTSAVAVDPLYPDHVYLGNDIGVYASTDGGASWSQLAEGLPEAIIAMDLTVSESNRNMRVATHGNGVWERPLLAPGTGAGDPLPPARPAARLAQNRPNPFNPSTQISYTVQEAGLVELAVYDLAGRRVRVLVAGHHEVGEYTLRFDGSGLASGIYVYRLKSGDTERTRRMILAK